MKSVKARLGAPRRAAKPRPRAAASASAAPRADLERRVVTILAAHPGRDVEQIAAELRVDLFDVADVVRSLIERGVVGDVESRRSEPGTEPR